MEFRILGPLQALSDGVPVDLGPHKQRALLVLLLLSANRVVSTDRILEELWGEESTGKEKALWVHVSRLRSALEPARAERGESSVLLTRDHGYVLQITRDALDAHRFEAAVAEGRGLLRDGVRRRRLRGRQGTPGGRPGACASRTDTGRRGRRLPPQQVTTSARR